jgi:dipeptidase
MNAFIIRDVDVNDAGNFLFSANLQDEAAVLGWDGEAALDFSLLFSAPPEPTCKYTSGRRVWSVFNTFAPSLSLPSTYEDYYSSTYPVSAAPDEKVNATAFRSMMRDTFEGTEYALGATSPSPLPGGPFGSASRWKTDQQVDNETVCFERSISTFKSIVSFVAEGRAWLPDSIGGLLHFTPHSARAGVMVPLVAGMKEIAEGFTGNSMGVLGRGTSAFWGARFLYNMIELKSEYAVLDVMKMQAELEDGVGGNLTAFVDAGYAAGELTMQDVQDLYNENAERAVQEVWSLSDSVMMMYVRRERKMVRPVCSPSRCARAGTPTATATGAGADRDTWATPSRGWTPRTPI